MTWTLACGSTCGCSRVSSWVGVTRMTASSFVRRPSTTMSTATFTAATGLRLVDVLWRANTGDDVFALGVHKVLAGEALGSSGIVAGETDARCRVVPHVAKNHGLNRHGCTNESTDLFNLAVGDGSVSIP